MDTLLQQKLTEVCGDIEGTEVGKITSLSGAGSYQNWKLTLKDGRHLFAKTTRSKDFRRLSFEAESLKALSTFANKNLLVIPKPLTIKKTKDTSILLMPWLDLGIGSQKALGRGLAMLHKKSTTQNPGFFGWENDGFIGAGIQPKGWRQSWGECFVNLRLIPQIKIAQSWGIEIKDFQVIGLKINQFLDIHNPSPCLVHGDLWSGNFGINKDGKGILIDPATWWADREVDLAMTRLFGGFSNDFYNSYEEIWPLPKMSKERVEIYNLYHLLNHANIFGGSYINQCYSSLDKITSFLI